MTGLAFGGKGLHFGYVAADGRLNLANAPIP